MISPALTLLQTIAFSVRRPLWIGALAVLFTAWSGPGFAQDAIQPPALGQETKGTPAIPEVAAEADVAVEASTDDEDVDEDENVGLLGRATITESKRESGQRYLIELDHSLGGTQYIEETDSDGKIESTSNDIEETPNLPKWKLGSW